ncbi:MAG: DUF4443 domain-containing protein [Patescibacteria group bacterium]|nr:DUF4443 domain-containing protein [Patescibacteria group bacterium]
MIQIETEIDRYGACSEINAIQLLRCLHKKPMGRIALTRELDLSESRIRTMLKTLNLRKLTKPTTLGQALTRKGKQITETINSQISYPKELDAKSFTLHDNNVAYLIKGAPGKIGNILDERDSAIKTGADGLIILVQKSDLELAGAGATKIKIPQSIKESFKLKRDDIIIITFARKKSISELAGLAAALKLTGFRLNI